MRTDRIAHILSLDEFGRIVTDFLFMHALCRHILFFLERVPRDFHFSWTNTNGYFGSFHMVSLDETVCRMHLELRWILSPYIIGTTDRPAVFTHEMNLDERESMNAERPTIALLPVPM